MKTSLKFQKIIRAYRKYLVEEGFNQYTVRSWAYGYRMPDFNNAVKLAGALGMDISSIPYRRIEVNRP